jgi:uncharacterized SAM-binding protein YcdF (DUF218 family)
MIMIVSVLFLLVVVLPTAPWALTYLENRYPRLERIPKDATGIIVLGGSFNLKVTQTRHVTSYNNAAGRIIAFAELAHQNPDKHLVFSGRGHVDNNNLSESHLAKKLFKGLGLDVSKITFEDKSKNTLENAVFTARLLKPNLQEKWVLVTSAYHMPRAANLFHKAGFHIIPYPVDYHTTGQYQFRLNLDVCSAFKAWRIAFPEFLSLTRNYLNGQSDEWIPGPH